MKLVRFGPAGREKPGIVDADGKIRDLSGVVPDIAGDTLSPAGLATIRNAAIASLPVVPAGTRIGPCVGKAGNFIAIGLNYADHAAEAGMPIPKDPTKLDYEIELGIVIGSRARYLTQDNAMDAVAGYCLANDVSEREFQIERSGQWTKGKGSETFGPIGPLIVTKDEIKNPQNHDMWLTVNGETSQKGTTRTMVFGVAHLVWYCSQFMVLEPGDVIITGTPPGVALGMKPEPKYLKPGDVVKLGIEGLREQTQKVVRFRA